MLKHALPGPRERREIRTVLTRVLAPLALVFVLAVLVMRHNHKPVLKLIGDPAAALRANPLLGFLSNVGVIGWCAGATVALFCGWLLWRWRAPREVTRFHVAAGSFTALLMADDFFLIHDHLAPRYLGLPEVGVYVIYAVLFALFLIRRRAEVIGRNPTLLALAVGLLGIMAGTDILFSEHSRLVGLGMAGSKFLGIYAWAAWLFVAARRDIEAARTLPTGVPARPRP